MGANPVPEPQRRTVEHAADVPAPAGAVYDLIADVAGWPHLFPPTVHAERLSVDGPEERIRLWATANGDVKTWTSRRTLDPGRRRIGFRQEVSQPPVGGMGGTWTVEETGPESCRVRLEHDYHAVDDDPEKLAWIDRAVDRNSEAELGALTAAASRSPLLSFEDSVTVAGSAKDAFAFINEAHLWAERLPHVARVDLREETPGLQVLEMDTRTRDGAVHTTRSVRVCLPPDRIVYKQIVLPALLALHTGEWRFTEQGDGLTVTSRHTVAIREEAIGTVLGPDADLAAARTFVRNALSANSTATLQHARAYAER